MVIMRYVRLNYQTIKASIFPKCSDFFTVQFCILHMIPNDEQPCTNMFIKRYVLHNYQTIKASIFPKCSDCFIVLVLYFAHDSL